MFSLVNIWNPINQIIFNWVSSANVLHTALDKYYDWCLATKYVNQFSAPTLKQQQHSCKIWTKPGFIELNFDAS